MTTVEILNSGCMDEKIPESIQKFNLDSIDLEIDRQSSAIYRGVMGLIILKGAFDFKTGKPPQFAKEKIQDDHIFPKTIYKYNSIPNRTLISTNLEKWKTEPSKYFTERLAEHGKETFKFIMESHLISGEAIEYLLKDDLNTFAEKRKITIVEEIKKRTGVHAHLFETLSPMEKSAKTQKKEEKKQLFPEHRQSWAKLLLWVDEGTRDLVKELTAQISSLGEVTHKPVGNDYCFYRGSKPSSKTVFAALLLRKSSVRVRIRTDPKTFKDSKKWVTDKVYRGWFFKTGQERTFDMKEKEQIPYAMELLKQSYDISI